MIGAVSRRVSSPVQIGRHEEMAALRAALQRASAGEPSVVLVAGEAGIGKSRLVAEFLTDARADGATVLMGGCVELGEDGLPYAPLVEMLRSLARERDPEQLERLLGPARQDLGRLVPDLAPEGQSPTPGAEASDQARLFERVLGLIDGLATERTVVLAIEDAHWADRSTRQLIRFIVPALREQRVVLIATFRDDELHRRHPLMPLLSELGRSSLVERIELRRLSREETAEHLAGILGTTPEPELVDRLFERADGNPFFLEELAAASAGGDDSALPSTIREIVAVRLARLPADSQHLVSVAAVIGRRAEHDLIATLAGLEPAAALEPLRTTVDERLLVAVDGGHGPAYEFRHALVAEALYDELLPAERTLLHAALARALEEQWTSAGDGSAAEIAHHWHRAHDLPRALEASLRAADEATRVFAFSEVHAQLERVLELWPQVASESRDPSLDRTRILERAADAAAAAGELARAIALARAALDELGPDGPLDRRLWLGHRIAWYHWDLGDADSAERTVQDALAVAEPAAPVARARLLSDLAQLHWSATRYEPARDTAAQALALARSAGDRIESARARMMLGTAMVSAGEVEVGIATLEQAVEEAGLEDGPEELRQFAGIELTHALHMADRNERVVEFGRHEWERVRASGMVRRYGAYITTNLVDPLLDLGRWDEAAALLDDPDWPRDGSRASAWVFEDIAELACLRGDLERARWAIASARDRLSVSGARIDPMWFERAASMVDRADGRLEDASRRLWSVIDAAHDPEHDVPLMHWVIPQAIATEADRADTAAARRDEATALDARQRGGRLVDLVERVATSTGASGRGPRLGIILAMARAERTRLEGRPDPDAWAAAAAVIRAPHELAVVRYREAEALLRVGDRSDRALAALRETVSIARRLGADPLADMAVALARRARIDLDETTRAEARAPRPAATASYGLSAREFEVLALVAEGWTNRQIGEALFITEKTASVHVTHILTKLGVTNRVEAAMLAARAGLVAGDDRDGNPEPG